jgi:hypothetical protein
MPRLGEIIDPPKAPTQLGDAVCGGGWMHT